MRLLLNGSVAALLVLSGCASESPRPGATSAPSTSPSASPSTPANALPDLAPFLAKARLVDELLATAAGRINAGVGADRVTFDARTVAAVRAADPSPVLDAIPPGAGPALLRSVLTVYSGLVSRHKAMASVRVGTFDRASADAREILRCLGNGHAAAARFPADLRAVETVVTRTPPLRPVARTSRAAAELAVRAADIRLRNSGCGECGGYVATSLATVRWDGAGSVTRYTGTVTGIPFVATYDRVRGWVAGLNAC
jgi:hypothetical protein